MKNEKEKEYYNFDSNFILHNESYESFLSKSSSYANNKNNKNYKDNNDSNKDTNKENTHNKVINHLNNIKVIDIESNKKITSTSQSANNISQAHHKININNITTEKLSLNKSNYIIFYMNYI